jgi:hypothetical protein
MTGQSDTSTTSRAQLAGSTLTAALTIVTACLTLWQFSDQIRPYATFFLVGGSILFVFFFGIWFLSARRYPSLVNTALAALIVGIVAAAAPFVPQHLDGSSAPVTNISSPLAALGLEGQRLDKMGWADALGRNDVESLQKHLDARVMKASEVIYDVLADGLTDETIAWLVGKSDPNSARQFCGEENAKNVKDHIWYSPDSAYAHQYAYACGLVATQ